MPAVALYRRVFPWALTEWAVVTSVSSTGARAQSFSIASALALRNRSVADRIAAPPPLLLLLLVPLSWASAATGAPSIAAMAARQISLFMR